MIALTAACPVHGSFDISSLFHGTMTIQFENSRVQCPVYGCRQMGRISDGTYDLVGSVVRAFTAPGVTESKIQQFADLAERVRLGKIDVEQAQADADAMGFEFAQLLDLVPKSKEGWALLMVIIQTFISALTLYISMVNAAEDCDRDCRREEIQQEIYKMLPESEAREEAAKPKMKSNNIAMATGPNRHERRKLAARKLRAKQNI